MKEGRSLVAQTGRLRTQVKGNEVVVVVDKCKMMEKSR